MRSAFLVLLPAVATLASCCARVHSEGAATAVIALKEGEAMCEAVE